MSVPVQRYLEEVQVGEELNSVSFPLTVYRLIMEAGANRDFNSIHHNSEYARATGAAEMYANTFFLLGMWERTVRDWVGLEGTIVAIRGFRMRSFNYVGDTTIVSGAVSAVALEQGHVSLALRSDNSSGLTVGPGTVTVSLPRREPGPAASGNAGSMPPLATGERSGLEATSRLRPPP